LLLVCTMSRAAVVIAGCIAVEQARCNAG